MKSKKYYTPVEFARLFRIDRQTLIYYDNHGVFSPSLKNENGYRYYSLDQVFRFAEILSLRNLSVPGSRLSDYNQQPTTRLLKEILHDKIMEYEDRVSELTGTIKALKSTVQGMDDEQYLPLDRIMLMPQGTRYCQRSRLLTAKTSHREALLQSAALVAMYAENNFSQHLQFSFMPAFSKLEDLAAPHDYHLILLSKAPETFSNPPYPAAVPVPYNHPERPVPSEQETVHRPAAIIHGQSPPEKRQHLPHHPGPEPVERGNG